MLEAVNTDLVFHHQPEAQHPKSSAIHKPPADYPIYASNRYRNGEALKPMRRVEILCRRGGRGDTGSV
jgi:hypothetical protein